MFAFDFGVWGYLYPGGQCFNSAAIPVRAFPARMRAAPSARSAIRTPSPAVCRSTATSPRRAPASIEGYAKVNVTINDQFQVGVNEYYSPNFLNLGAWGNYASITGKWTAPSTTFRLPAASACTSRASSAGSGWERRTAFYGTADQPGFREPAFLSRATTPGTSASASPTRCSRWICATPTPTCRRATATPSPATTHRAGSATARQLHTAINPLGFGSNWCGAAGIVKLSADLTAVTNLK